jgi:hypothetical protein
MMQRRLLFFAVFLVFFPSFAEDLVLQKSIKPYVGADIYLSQSIGAGTFSPSLAPKESLLSELSLYPTVKSANFWGDRYIKSHLEFTMGYEWLGGVNDGNRMSFADVRLRVFLQNALKSESLGISFTPGLKLEFPTTQSSLRANRIIGIGSNMKFKWSKWGVTLDLKPTVMGYVHSLPYKTMACTPESKAEDHLSDGNCTMAGAQTMMMFKNGVYLSYAHGDHALMLGFKSFHGILRPPADGNVNAQSYTEATLGLLEYTYTVPLTFPFDLSLGVTSFNPTYDPRGGFRMPFFSKNAQAENFSSIYFAFSMTV